MDHCILCLHELPLFEGLEHSEFTGICLNSIKKQIPSGAFLFRQGEIARTIYLIKAGKLKLVQVTVEGREIIFDIVGPGEVIGETALFKEQKWLFSGIAQEETRLCCFNREQFEVLINQNPNLALGIISHLSQKLYETLRQARENIGIPVKEKLIRLLMRLAQEHGRKIPGAVIIELVVTQQDLADMIGSSRVMVAQVIRELKKTGIVSKRDRNYILKNDPCINKYFT